MNIKQTIRKAIPKSAMTMAEQSYRYIRGFLLYWVYGMKSTDIKLVGITGTNGKTTSNSYLNEILKAAGKTTAITTTVHTEINGEYQRNKHHLTSGTTAETFKFIKQANDAGIDYAVIEVTSQALHQHKHWGLNYDGVGVTNLSYEHMEYHKTMEHYAMSKALLLKKNPKSVALNFDDEWFDYFNKIQLPNSTKKYSFSVTESGDIQIRDVNSTTKGSTFNLVIEGKKIPFETSLVGTFNVYNATTAAVVAYGLGVPIEAIQKGVKNLTWVDGRVNPIDEGQDFAVFTDYAHTPDGLEKVLETLKEMTRGDLILVQSTMDGRDPKKWPKLGEVSAKIADRIYVCDEEAFTLPREVMRNAIIDGIKKAGGENKYIEIEDRQEAIEAAIASAKKDDTVLVVPFGHITEMTFYDKTIHWDERAVTANAIRKVLGKPLKKISTKVEGND